MKLEPLIVFFLLLFIVVAIGGAYLNERNISYPLHQGENRNQEVLNLDDVFNEPLTLWWPGISGVEPRYFGKKGMKGLGWEEFPVYKLKDRLSQKYGVNIKDWMASPSRIDREFELNRRPVCIYPYKWKNPELEFSKPRTYLLSKALDYSGEKSSAILIRKDDRDKFSHFQKENGNLDLQKLIDTTSIKTAMIKGTQYDLKVMKIFNNTDNDSWELKPAYQKNILMMVASDNQQLLKMLDGGRVDYIFDDLVTSNHYQLTGIAPSKFIRLVYNQLRVESIKSTNLVRHSIKCNLHPLNYKIMPTINESVFLSHNNAYTWLKYREKLDSSFNAPSTPGGSLLGRFTTTVNHNWWYKEFEVGKDFQPKLSEKVNPKEDQTQLNIAANESSSNIAKVSRNVLFAVFRKNDQLAIVDPGLHKSSIGSSWASERREPIVSMCADDISNHLVNETTRLLKETPANSNLLKL